MCNMHAFWDEIKYFILQRNWQNMFSCFWQVNTSGIWSSLEEKAQNALCYGGSFLRHLCKNKTKWFVERFKMKIRPITSHRIFISSIRVAIYQTCQRNSPQCFKLLWLISSPASNLKCPSFSFTYSQIIYAFWEMQHYRDIWHLTI